MASDIMFDSTSTTNLIEIMAALTIFITISFHALSVYLAELLEKHKHLSEMLQHLYRELMVLGFVSTSLFLIESLTPGLGLSTRHLFETIHMMVFFLVIGYTIMTVLLMILSVWLSRHWHKLEEHDHSDYMNIKNEFDELKERRESLSYLHSIFNLSIRIRYYQLVEQIAFHDLRLHFIHSNHLSPVFSFARYLRKCKQHVFLQLGDLHTMSWMFLLLLLAADLLARQLIVVYFGVELALYFHVLVALFALSLCGVSIAVLVKVRKVLSEILCHSEMIDFDPIAARFYIDHWRDPAHGDNSDLSISYPLMDDNEKDSSTARFRAESATRHVAKTFRISHWGLTGDNQPIPENNSKAAAIAMQVIEDKGNGDMQTSINMAERASRAPRLSRVQSVHVEEFEQLDLLWFRSHAFMLRLMQLLVFMLVLFVTCMFRFWSLIFAAGGFLFVLPLLILTPLVVLGSLSIAIPIFTIIIHIGQLVDLEIVLEAKRKGAPKRHPERAEHALPNLQSSTAAMAMAAAAAVNGSASSAPPKLTRCSTLQMLDTRDRRRIKVASFMFSRSMQTVLSCLVMLHVSLVIVTLEPLVYNLMPDHTWDIILFIIPSLFLVEMSLKLYSTGIYFLYGHNLVWFDVSVIFLTFLCSALSAAGLISRLFCLIVIARLAQILCVTRLGRMMLHQREEALEHSLLAQINRDLNEPSNQQQQQQQQEDENPAVSPSTIARRRSSLLPLYDQQKREA